MNVVLQLKCVAEPQRAIAAWWLAQDSAAEWLAEVTRWTTTQSELQLLAVPGESAGTTSGILVTFPADDATSIQACCPAGVAYGRVGKRLFVPLEARFDPPATDAEVATLLPADDSVYVWHPARGLIRCDVSGRRELRQLLAMPIRNGNRWNRAVPGTTLNDRLISIEPLVAPEIDEFLRAARGDIATQGSGLGRLPISPVEMRSWRRIVWLIAAIAVMIVAVVIVLKLLTSGIALNWPLLFLTIGIVAAALWLLPRFIRWLKEAAKTGAGKQATSNRASSRGSAGSIASWFAGARRWVAERAAAFDEQLDALRNREINRLLHMLDARPDDGLRYAIPLGGEANHRGVVARGAQLFERLVDFSLGRLGGGAPADYWGIEPTYQARLVAKYRELANREISLGRHRRAAYIFAELLGDLRSAAATLADGGYYREAAALYDQRLKDAHAAAQCLERGGLLSEAIVFYHGFGNHEKVGELYEKLEQWDFAQQAFRRALQTKLDTQDYLSAARLAEDKLHQPDEALHVLLQGWPDSAQATICLDESFKLLGRRAAHEQAAKQLIHLARDYGHSGQATQLATCFARLASVYPDLTVRMLAADQTRVLAAHRLTEVSNVERRKFLQAVQQLVPQDLLLARDCSRFQNLSFEKPKPDLARVAHEFRLPEGVWKAAIAIGDEFYAAGWRGNEVLLVRGLWDGTLHQPAGKPWKSNMSNNDTPIELACSGQDGAKILVYVPGERISSDRQFPRTDWFGERTAGGHSALNGTVTGLNVSKEGILDTIRLGEQLFTVTSHVVQSGELIRTLPIHPFEIDPAASDTEDTTDPLGIENQICIPTVVTRFGNQLVVAAGRKLFQPGGQTPHLSCMLPFPAKAMFAWKSATHTLFVALLEVGAMVWFGSPFARTGSYFAEELADPVGCCVGEGWIVVADSTRIQFYKVESPNLRLIATRHGQFDNPIALLALPAQNQVALFLSDGRVLIQTVP